MSRRQRHATTVNSNPTMGKILRPVSFPCFVPCLADDAGEWIVWNRSLSSSSAEFSLGLGCNFGSDGLPPGDLCKKTSGRFHAAGTGLDVFWWRQTLQKVWKGYICPCWPCWPCWPQSATVTSRHLERQRDAHQLQVTPLHMAVLLEDAKAPVRNHWNHHMEPYHEIIPIKLLHSSDIWWWWLILMMMMITISWNHTN